VQVYQSHAIECCMLRQYNIMLD